MRRNMKLEAIRIYNPNNLNLILGQSHFIKTVEDLHEVLVASVPGIKFGLAFSEASGDKLIRTSGNKEDLIKLAVKNVQKIASGHCFLIFMENAFPINMLNAIKQVPEVINIYCATANPVEVIVARTKLGGAILGIVDGGSPSGIEKEKHKNERKEFLRKIGYKL